MEILQNLMRKVQMQVKLSGWIFNSLATSATTIKNHKVSSFLSYTHLSN